MSLFELDNITVKYEDLCALKEISLTIEEGEKVAVIGPSGAGKSTLLKYLYSINPEKCSVIHQDFALIQQLSVFHNVYIGRLNRHSLLRNIRNLVWPLKEDIEEIRVILQELEIADKTFTKTAALSGGQQQRVSISRALYRDSDIILGDEPVSSLDLKNARTVIDKLMQKDKTVIFSLHNVELARKHSERIIALKDGKLFFDRPSAEVTMQDIQELYHS